MPSTHIQFVKWSFPAFALIIGLLWYKRRRVDRADPGGNTKSEPKRNTGSVDIKSEKAMANGSSSLCDSGIHIDESFALNSSSQPSDEVVCSSRRVSESLDIPIRRSSSHPMSIQSGKSSSDSQIWYKDTDVASGVVDVQLGSNPRTSNFDMAARSRGGSSFVADSKMPMVFETMPENGQCRSISEVEPFGEVHEDHSETVHVEDDAQAKNAENSTPDEVKAQVSLSERDSANHSPVSGVLEGSVADEARSEGSTDSGKGGSIQGHAKDSSGPAVYEFTVPQNLVGRFIGRHGSFLQTVRTKAEVHIVMKRHPMSNDVRVCAIVGTTDAINAALELIRQRFPLKKYPVMTLERIMLMSVPEEIPWVADVTCLSLVEGVSNDVIVCHILKPNRLFVQLPTHPSYPSLRMLDANMTQLYSTTESPGVPDHITKGMIFVAKWFDRWIRVYVEIPDPQGERHLVRSLDHGGYWHFSSAEMRKIRSDYLLLPFQAIEVCLSNVQSKDGEWHQEAFEVVIQMCSGVVAQAHIEGYIDTNTFVNLYLNIPKHGVISLGDELIARGLAVSVPFEETVPEKILSSS